MEKPCPECNSAQHKVETDYGTRVCTKCGVEDWTLSITQSYNQWSVPLQSQATYTRVKRFRKYLQRASMEQSAATIPETTWAYLLEGMPYRGPQAVVRRLKKAPKQIRKKCYDSLPLLVKMLCPNVVVPRLSEVDKKNAMRAFRKLDTAYDSGEPFVSYLFALEYILEHIGRADMLPFINKICCRKRRSAYRMRLGRILNSSPRRFF